MKRCMQYFCIGLILSFQLTAQASIRNIEDTPVNFDGIKNFKIMNDFGYITLGSDGLKFFELSKPNNIEECSNKVVHCQLLGNSVNQLDIVGDYVYLLTDYGLEIVDSSRTQRVGALAINDTRKIVLQNDLAYIISGDKQVHIVDVSNTKSPKKLSTFESDLYGFDKIAVSDSYIYLTGTGVRYFFIVDVSNPASPKETIRYVTKETVSNLAVIGDYLYVIGSSASIFDVKTDPSNPKEIKLANPLYFSPLSNIIIQGKYAYFIGSDSLTIVDITNPKNPISKESYSFPNNTTYKVGVATDKVNAVEEYYIFLMNGTTFTLLQFFPVPIVCSYSVTPNNITLEDYVFNSPYDDGIGIGNLEVKTNNSFCEWTGKVNTDWLAFVVSDSTGKESLVDTIQGVGNGNVKYIYSANSDFLVRDTQITVANQVINISQKQAQGLLLFDGKDDSMVTYPSIESKYVKVYKEGETIQPITLTFRHFYNQLKRTDLWLILTINGTDWYKEKPFETGFPYGFVRTTNIYANNLFMNKPFSAADENSNSTKWMDDDLEWTVVPLLSASGGFYFPKGEYTFYALATVRGEDKTTSPSTLIYYNPIVHYNDLKKLFSNLAVFKLIIQ